MAAKRPTNLDLTKAADFVITKMEVLRMRPEAWKKGFGQTDEIFKKMQPVASTMDRRALDLDQPAGPSTVGAVPTKVDATTGLKQIANKAWGEPSRWRELVRMNDLKAPYIDYTGQSDNNTKAGTVKPGATIQVPVEQVRRQPNPFIAGRDAGAASTNSPLALERRTDDAYENDLLGCDIQLTADGDFAMNSHKNDFAVCKGVRNLVQALDIKLKTPQGGNDLYPYIGFKNIVGSALTLNKILEGRSSLERTLLLDNRVGGIKRVSVKKAQGTGIEYNVAIWINGLESTAVVKKEIG